MVELEEEEEEKKKKRGWGCLLQGEPKADWKDVSLKNSAFAAGEEGNTIELREKGGFQMDLAQ